MHPFFVNSAWHVQIMKIRKTLTEVLLEVTNQEVLDVATETLEEERSKFVWHQMLYVCTVYMCIARE